MKICKYFLIMVVAVILIFNLTACGPSSISNFEGNSTSSILASNVDSSMFITVEDNLIDDFEIVYHRDTKVMYAISQGSYNYGNFTLLVNADGTPMTYQGY